MKLVFSKQVYDQFDYESRRALVPIACDCVADSEAKPDCDLCEGCGTLWEASLSAEDQAAIQENFRSQGLPLGKTGTQ